MQISKASTLLLVSTATVAAASNFTTTNGTTTLISPISSNGSNNTANITYNGDVLYAGAGTKNHLGSLAAIAGFALLLL